MVNFILDYAVILWVGACLFIFGTVVGSFLNVWIARLPFEKSIVWPGSRCGNCQQPVRMFDNIPLLSYWLLGGKCRSCKAPFSIRYFLVELLVGLGFVALFYLEIVRNVHQMPAFSQAAEKLKYGLFSRSNWPALVFFLQRAALFSLLVAAAFCDLNNRTIPLGITLFGTAVGLVFSTALPWPWPNDVAAAMSNARLATDEWWLLPPNEMQKLGLSPWPVWGPLPAWLPAGSWKLGLATGLAGALVGTFMLRSVKFLFEKGLRKEALGEKQTQTLAVAR